ncbi:photosystem II oxygen evolving complex protein PsbP [Gloeothece citriformis PCC 7424]|uniref:Photosystem II oxygen evolving complex protein PsbP n=1 Tax=Gloeothece citriformis (strain PCC 7424) TaxID=65393 RepID=B7KJY1_GLOC7|nr:photosystem II reaction center PsbP [Gloeothece citriformis]ACK69580.1 photosystem II oxygen evolving complex protein PsbP [Gloeothece citriformis PCC 7424]
MLRAIVAALVLIISLTLSSCASDLGGLQSYVNPTSGYEFLYPNGWIPVDVKNASDGVDLVYRDLIERSENLSVIISDVPEGKDLSDIGTPSDVGYRFFKAVNNDSNLNRNAELIRADSHEENGKTYYILEYQVKLPDNTQRHDLASVAVSRGKLYTFNLSTPQQRWDKVKDLFETSVRSFSVY